MDAGVRDADAQDAPLEEWRDDQLGDSIGATVGHILRGHLPRGHRLCDRANAHLVAVVAPLVHLPSMRQRELAYDCLLSMHHPATVPVLLEIFADARFNPRNGGDHGPYNRWEATVDALRRLVGREHVPLILAAYDTCAQERGRFGLAELLLRLAEPQDIPALRERLQAETGRSAKIVLVSTLARLGDEESQRRFSSAFRAAPLQARCGFMKYAHIVRGPWLLPELARLLRRHRRECIGPFVSNDESNVVAELTSDFAVREIALITGHKFSFDLDRTSFKAEERREVEAYVRTLLAPDAGPK